MDETPIAAQNIAALRKRYLHYLIEEKLQIKILKQDEYYAPEQQTRFFDIIKLTPFLYENGAVEQLIEQVVKCDNETESFPSSNLLHETLPYITLRDELTTITFLLKQPYSFVWYIEIEFAILDYQILYPAGSFTLYLSEAPTMDNPIFKAQFDLSVTEEVQTFELPENLPCFRFATIIFDRPLQKNPLTFEKVLAFNKIHIFGVSINHLASFAMKARNQSRISTKLTRSSLIGNQHLRESATSIKGFEQTLETVNIIAEQHRHRKAFISGNPVQVLSLEGTSAEAVTNDKWATRWM